MREILLTSSVLILAVLLLRRAFRDRISRRAQYVLWALVLVRLLVPVSLPGADFSVLSAAEPVGRTVTERLEQREIYRVPLAPSPMGTAPQVTSPAPQIEGGGSPSGEAAAPSGGEEAFSYPVIRERVVTAADLLTVLWLIGIAAMAVWFLVTNLRFWQKLRRTRAPYAAENCRYPVYLVEAGLPSPCLFGPVRPAIYLTPAAVETPERLRHVLAHETAHARHLDPLWSLLRSVCLAVYWFDPLVWIAAAVSKADGELACDEAAIQALGEGERIPYGKTLLSLIAVRTGPGSPLLSATTMTADKRQLKDRITRIAQGQQTRAAALFLVLALAAGVCAVTFTGAKADGETGGVRSLTGDELAYFNEEFFNQEGTYSIRNQFLNSLYEKPEDIDLFELFYCGTGIDAPMTDEELRQVGSFDTAGELICPVDKMSVEAINQVLLENTGLTLEETGRIGMDYFQYLPEYDAYYHSHGDTNYFSGVNITAGERVGDTIRLYYDDTFHVDGWKCVTLEEQADGSYWFVSNQPSERPAIPTVYPEGEPVLTIPLTDLTPYEPETMEAIRHRNDCAERGTGYIMHTEDGDELSVRTYLSTDGNLYAAVIYDEAAGRDGMRTWDVGCFFTFPEHNTLSYSDSGGYAVSMDSFSDLFGHDGLVIRYSGELDEHTGATFHDYYYFDTEGNPVLLARVYGDTAQFDLDGNGADELCASSANTAQIFFQRDGRIYEADIDEDLKQAWPDAEYLSFNRWDVSRRNLALWAFVPIPDSPQDGTADRWLYFDGENLLVYRDGRATADHLMEGAEAPEDVMAVLRDYVQEQYTGDHEGLLFVEGGDFVPAPLEYDDWRIESIEGPSYVSVGGLDFAIWSMNYELHTTTPESVILAGGTYMTEDCWVSPGYPGCDYFYFQLDEGGTRTYLYHRMENDCVPGTELFFSDMAYQLREMGLLSFYDLTGRELLDISCSQPVHFFNTLSETNLSEQSQALAAMAACVAAGDDPGTQEIYDSIAHYMEIFSDDLTDGGRAAWQALQSALSSWTAAGDGTVYESGGLSLWVPEGWADMAAVTAEDAVWFGESVPGFDVYERLAHISNPDTGLVWNVRALTRAQFQAAFGDADWSEILGASSYVIGSDDAYIYLFSTPTDVQFLVEDPTSMAQYELLRNQSQTVIEGFFFRNGITPNPDCPDADGCYVGPEASGRPEVNEAAKAAVQAAMDGILAPGAFSLTLSPAPGGSGGGSYILPLDMAAAISRMPENFLWYPAEAGSPPAGLASLTLTAEDGSAALQCWEGSSLVRCTRSGVTQWFYAPPVTADAVFNGTVFAALRQIYVEVEWEALREGIIIPDRGQSHLEIAQAWADADTQPALEVTDGSIFACTYVRTVADVDSWADMPETSYPEQSEGHERFWFSYRRIFVPENEAARSWQMAGNTVEYDGRYGEAPEGAYENFQVGVLYLTDEGWRCDGTGTGP